MAEDKNTHPETYTKNAATQKQPVPPAPTPANQPPSGMNDGQPQPANSQGDSPEKPLPRFERPEWIIVYVTVVYVVIAGLTLVAILKQANLMERQTRIAARNVKAFISKERARLSVKLSSRIGDALSPTYVPEAEGELLPWDAFEVQITHDGETAAYNVLAVVWISIGDSEDLDRVIRVDRIVEIGTMKKGKERPSQKRVTVSPSWLTQSHLDLVRNGTSILYLRGQIVYRDAFEVRRKTYFRYRWDIQESATEGQRNYDCGWERDGPRGANLET